MRQPSKCNKYAPIDEVRPDHLLHKGLGLLAADGFLCLLLRGHELDPPVLAAFHQPLCCRVGAGSIAKLLQMTWETKRLRKEWKGVGCSR